MSGSPDQQEKNRLADSPSLYLRQHKDNPVHWWPYGPGPLQKARDENKPIFLSVGYSSCHWCHVMAQEVFSDPETADYLNEHFVCIKVDREEHPDIDNYYQQACQLYAKSGGWPLSAFLLPDTRPFFVGTYFPKQSSEKVTGFLDLLKELVRANREEPEQVEANAQKVTKMIQEGIVNQEKVEFQGHFPAPSAILQAVDKFFDQENGGYGAAPKFPHFAYYEWAIEQMLEGMIPKEQGEKIVMTLEKMLMGGLYDQARGGIHRYSTDSTWSVPHFEKMLYDQAGLLKTLAKFSLLYPSPLVYDALINTLDYLEVEMFDDEKKYFFSAQDADSEGVEGLYFCFSKEEFDDALNQFDDEKETLGKNREKLYNFFQITEKGNFSQGLNVPTLNYSLRSEIFTQEGWDLVRKTRQALTQARKMRIPPATDNKGVASWNFMMIEALCDVLQYCRLDVVRERASQLFNQALEGAYQNFVDASGPTMKLRHTTTLNEGLPYFEDYATFASVQLRVYEVSGNPTFKENLKEGLKFLEQEFISGDQILTRAKYARDFEPYPNHHVASFDASFASPVSTYLGLARRAEVLFSDPEITPPLEKLKERLTHEVLKNPLSAGQALRALSYPDQAYRTLKLPQSWLKDQRFIEFMPYFLPRFSLNYLKDEEKKWQICGLKECELQGEGLDEFIQVLTPKKPEDSAKPPEN